MSRTFKIILEKERSGGYSVVVPSLPGCCTQGETIEECMANAKEAILLYIESMKEDLLSLLLKSGTLRAILKGCQISIEEFKALL